MGKRKRQEENELEIDTGGIPTEPRLPMTCDLPSCPSNSILFSNYYEYENHIVTSHNYICIECKRKFPSEYFLNLHIDENHNPLLKIKQEQGTKIFKCLQYSDEGCKRFFSTPKKRRLHMIDKHHYPKDFDFGVINNGIKYDQ
ncbi:uncharacterized protein PRCAT00001893001 [Priceomyces carsonii]|uniref:uncharacterized protein n=1 Tax=Priceomyces carsonii TaxID=28549 RepID=UPI002EDB1272|nr:unnamed protein product [Priceomyces carsonii]